MSNRKKRQENLQKRIQKICFQAKEERDKPVGRKTEIKSTIQPCQNVNDHEWEKYLDLHNNTQTEYFCANCFEHKIEKNLPIKKFQYTILPYEIKHHGPAEHHPDPRKYTAPKKEKSWKGNQQKKEEIFKRCVKNNKILSSENPTFIEINDSLDKIIPLLILDECSSHPTLFKKLEDAGYDGKYLVSGSQDDDIFEEVIKKNAILVTEDKEFYNRVLKTERTNDPIFLARNSETIMENLHLIINHMRKFEH